MTITFHTPTELPMLAITTLGISVKEGDNPIGKFGTGLKYTIAGVLRLGGSITITTMGKTYSFYAQTETVRSKTFDVVHMCQGSQSYPLGFTTDLGKHWEPWMYIRELWSNTEDEGGTHGMDSNPNPDGTSIVVECIPLELSYRNLHSFILHSEPLASSRIGEVHPRSLGQREHCLFYRRIRVVAFDAPTKYNYNILANTNLTEDRTISNVYQIRERFTDLVCTLEDRKIINTILACKPGTFEHDMLWTPNTNPSDTFMSCLEEVWMHRPFDLNADIRTWAARKFKIDTSTVTKPFTPAERRRLDEALELLKPLCFTDWPEIHRARDATADLFGYVRDGQIFLTELCLQEGTSAVAATLVEEYLHAKENLSDYTRSFQDRLLRLLIAQLEDIDPDSIVRPGWSVDPLSSSF